MYAHSREIKALTARCRADLVARAGRADAGDPVHLRTIYARDPQQPVLKRKNYAKEDAAVIASAARDIKEGEPLTRSDLGVPAAGRGWWRPRSRTGSRSLESLASCARPLGYVVPAARRDVISLLQKLGVHV